MSDPEPILLLTRPEAQSRAFLSDCEARAGRSLPAVIAPVLKIEPTGGIPELDRFDTIILTSANAVGSLADRTDMSGRRVVTVGERTAEAARAVGADATVLGEDADALVAEAERIEGRAILCRGVHVRGDIADRLRDRGVPVEEAVVYDQVAQPLTPAAAELLAGRRHVLVPLFSPRSAALLAGHAGIRAPLTVVAMSRNVARSWTGPGRIVVAERPSADAMCDKVVAHFSSPSLGLGGAGV